MRKWKLDTDLTREKVSLVAAKLQKKMGTSASRRDIHHESDSDSEDSVSGQKGTRRLSSNRRFSNLFLGNSDEKNARRELRIIVESSDDAMFCIDEKGEILLTNDAAVKQFGHSKKEFIGSNISMICNAKDAPQHGEYLDRYVETGEKRVMGKKRELLAMRKDGSTFYIELGLTEVNLGGGKFIFCGFVKDITALRSHRRSLERSISKIDLDTNKKEEEEAGSHNTRSRGLPPLVEWCLTILSEYVENYGYESNRRPNTGEDDDESSVDASATDLKASFISLQGGLGGGGGTTEMRDTVVVEKIASIPHLLEELLLIEDTEARSRIFDMSIVHKVLFSVDSLGKGDWLVLDYEFVLCCIVDAAFYKLTLSYLMFQPHTKAH